MGFQLMSVYRARSIVWLFIDIFILFIMPFLWLSVYGDAGSIAGFDKRQMVTYFIGVAVVRVAVSSHLEVKMRQEIKDGRFTNYMVKPMNHLLYTIMREQGWRAAYTLHFIPVLLAALFIFKDYIELNFTLQTISFVIIAFIFSHILFSLLNYIIGITAFYLIDADSAAQFFWLAFSLFSGTIAPLVFFPQWLQRVADVLPFKYLVSFPLTIFFNHYTTREMLTGYGIQIMWIAASLLVISITFKRGIKKYEAIGI